MSSSLRKGARATRRLLDAAKQEIAKVKDSATGRGRAAQQSILRRLKGSKSKLEEVAWNVLIPQIPILRKRFGESTLEVSKRVRLLAYFVTFAADVHRRFLPSRRIHSC